MPLLVRNGRFVTKNGRLVTTDNPAGCDCCGPPPPVFCNCCDEAGDSILLGPCLEEFTQNCASLGGASVPGDCCPRAFVANGSLSYVGQAEAIEAAKQLTNSGFTARVTFGFEQSVSWWCYRSQVLDQAAPCTNPICKECKGPLAPCLNNGVNPLP